MMTLWNIVRLVAAALLLPVIAGCAGTTSSPSSLPSESLLAAAGFSEGDRHRWHADFERQAPEKHQRFLEFLCLPDAEITAIRARARTWRRADGAQR